MARRALLAIFLGCAAFAAFAAGTEELGTLFTTPEERARLDKLRRGEPVDPRTGLAAVPGPRALTGFVQRSDGRTTVWIDGDAVTTRNAPKIDPKSVREDAGNVKLERKAAR